MLSVMMQNVIILNVGCHNIQHRDLFIIMMSVIMLMLGVVMLIVMMQNVIILNVVCHDIKHNDIQHNGTKHNIQHK